MQTYYITGIEDSRYEVKADEIVESPTWLILRKSQPTGGRKEIFRIAISKVISVSTVYP